MKFAKWSFRIAGVWGFLILVPLYFMAANPKVVPPPALAQPEYYYGFLAVTLAWQAAFLAISTDPARYRPLMVPCMMEKFLYTATLLVLYFIGRLSLKMLVPEAADFTLGILFVVSFVKTKPGPEAK